MKKRYLMIIIVLTLLSACEMNQSDQALQEDNISSAESIEIPNIAVNESIYSETAKERIEHYIESQINDIRNFFDYSIYDCADGNQILEIYPFSAGIYYLCLIPSKLPDGDWQFFEQLYFSDDILYLEDGWLEIPLIINDSKDSRLSFKGRAVENDGEWELTETELIIQSEQDVKFNQKYSQLDINERIIYRKSLHFERSLPDDEAERFFKSCVYNGNLLVLDELYRLTPDSEPDQKYKIELAMKYAIQKPLSADNPYKSEILWGESCQRFPRRDALLAVAKSMQSGTAFEASGVQSVISNLTWEELKSIPNTQGDRIDWLAGDNALGIYKYDLDNDGLQEILVLLPGGSIGNEFWKLIRLDKDGHITSIKSGESELAISLYCYGEEYFILSNIKDSYDYQHLGYNMYAMNSKGEIFHAQLCFDRLISEMIFSDNSAVFEQDIYFYLWYTNRVVNEYKSYQQAALGDAFEPKEAILQLFDDPDTMEGVYGTLDVNNDGVEDWTMVAMYYSNKQWRYHCNYIFVDGETNKKLDFKAYFKKQNFNLCRIALLPLPDKNYFICVGNEYGNYLIKVIEIVELEPIEIHNGLITEKQRLLVQVL